MVLLHLLDYKPRVVSLSFDMKASSQLLSSRGLDHAVTVVIAEQAFLTATERQNSMTERCHSQLFYLLTKPGNVKLIFAEQAEESRRLSFNTQVLNARTQKKDQ